MINKLLGIPRLDFKILDPVLCQRGHSAVIDHDPLTDDIQIGGCNVIFQGHLEEQPINLSVFCHISKPHFHGMTRISDMNDLIIQKDFSRSSWIDPKDGARQLAAPSTGQAEQAQHFATIRHQADIRKAFTAEVVDLEQRHTVGDLGMLKHLAELSAHHHLDDVLWGCFIGIYCSHQVSIFQYRDAIGNFKDLVQLVAYIYNAHPLIAQCADYLEETHRFFTSDG